MKKNLIFTIFLAAVMAFAIGCSGDNESDNPVILMGLISLDTNEVTNAPDNNNPWTADVKIYNVTSNKVIAQTSISNIQGFPVLYQIRKNFSKVYTEYWDKYKVVATVYDENSVPYTGEHSLDLNNYNYERNIKVTKN